MTDEFIDKFTDRIVERIKLSQRVCMSETASDNIVIQHSALLSELRGDIKNINAKLEGIDRKFGRLFEKHDDHAERLTKMESEKKTFIALVLAGASAVGWFLDFFFKR